MSVSIGYRPHNPKSMKWVEGGSSFLRALEKAFGELPTIVDDTGIAVLRGIQCAGYEGAEDLISAITEFGTIEIDKQY